MRRNADAMRRAQARRQREAEADRLTDIVPELIKLQLVIHETRPKDAASAVTHKRYVMVARAPALFVISCSDNRCDDGGHDVTSEVLEHLSNGERTFEGEHHCEGVKKLGPCNYDMRFVAEATYG